MSKEWSNGICGCFGDITVCKFCNFSRIVSVNCVFFSIIGLLSYFVPCVVFGQNAEKLGESCVMYGLSQVVPLLNLYCRTSVRGRIREQKGIEGSCFKDLLCVLFCPMCALAQEAQVKLLTYA